MPEDARLPAHLEVAMLIRSVQAEGGFAAVLRKGEKMGGTLLLLLVENGAEARLYERMPQIDGTRRWDCIKTQGEESPQAITEYLDRRARQDEDLWIVELDIAQAERFIR